MPNHVNQPTLWLVGAGPMAVDYAKVLIAQKVPFEVIGRSTHSARLFTDQTGLPVFTGGLEKRLEQGDGQPLEAIVAVGVEQLEETVLCLLKHGVKRILVEKPAGMDEQEIRQVAQESAVQAADVFVAYNRRFYASVRKAREVIKADGGVTSFNFEFTEWSHRIVELDKSKRAKEQWFLLNSTHVVDMAFFLGGQPQEMTSFKAGSLSWHPSASRYAGSGVTKAGALFSYQANWEAPGRWSVEILTPAHRLIFRPLEQLQIQKIGSVVAEEVPLDDEWDRQFKPGLYHQVQAFLQGKDSECLATIAEHATRTHTLFSIISNGGNFGANQA